jgi:hypothetical protein
MCWKGFPRRACPGSGVSRLRRRVARAPLVHGDTRSNMPLFCNQRGQRLKRFGIGYILTKYFRAAVIKCPSLANKRLHPPPAQHSDAIAQIGGGPGNHKSLARSRHSERTRSGDKCAAMGSTLLRLTGSINPVQ